MKIILLVILSSHLCISFSFGQGTTFTKADIEALANFIESQQLPNGAIKFSKSPEVGGKFLVNPYFNHIACLGLLESSNTAKCQVIKKWLAWYINHFDERGLAYNYYYNDPIDPTQDSLCLKPDSCKLIDAEDSYLALFWDLLYQYYRVSQDKSIFTGSLDTVLQSGAKYLKDSLMQPDNLSIAKPSYAIKFLMDNSEIYKGLLSLSLIEGEIYNHGAEADSLDTLAQRVKQSIQTKLYPGSKLYYHSLDINGRATYVDPTKWYDSSGIVAIIWPQLFEIETTVSPISVYQRKALNKKFPYWTSFSYYPKMDDYTWPSIGYAFSKAGDTANGFKHTDNINKIFVANNFDSPCTVSDAGWLIMNMAIRFPPEKKAIHKRKVVSKN
ncbi:hypothetical protein [Parasediminibacterium sp. JCM 36343]|uniref:hypothetical protein n=1 Tax=Parasediminibacterium sp. JCM 36343 TaxID=3374279 RepID=UPI00397A3EDC